MVACETCGKEVKDRRALAGHRRFVHPETVTFRSPQEQEGPFGLGNPPGRAVGRPTEMPFQSPPWYESTDKLDELARNAALAARLKLDENPRVENYLSKIGFDVEKAIRAAVQVVANQLKADNGEFENAGDVPTMEAFINDLEKRFEVAYEDASVEQIEELVTSQDLPAVVTEAQCRQIVHSEFMALAQLLVASAQDRADNRHLPGPCEERSCKEGCNTRLLKAKGEIMAVIEHRLPDTFKELTMIETAMRSGDPLKLPTSALHLIDEVNKRGAETATAGHRRI